MHQFGYYKEVCSAEQRPLHAELCRVQRWPDRSVSLREKSLSCCLRGQSQPKGSCCFGWEEKNPPISAEVWSSYYLQAELHLHISLHFFSRIQMMSGC